MIKFDYKFSYSLKLQQFIKLNIFLLDVNFEKSFIRGIHFPFVSSILAKFLEVQRLIVMLSINLFKLKIFVV